MMTLLVKTCNEFLQKIIVFIIKLSVLTGLVLGELGYSNTMMYCTVGLQ